jgi:hypothetical protein
MGVISRLLVLAALAVAVTVAPSAMAVTVAPGFDASAHLNAAARFRSFGNTGGEEVYVGVPDLGVAGNRVGTNLVWGADNAIEFSYDGASTLKATVNGTELTYATLTPGQPMNYLQFSVVARDSGATVELLDLELDGVALGDYSASGAWNTWHTPYPTGLDLSGGFTITGRIVLTGSFGNSQELSKVVMLVGHVVPLPAAAWAGLSLLGVLGAKSIKRRQA